jgi:hypothetical protein
LKKNTLSGVPLAGLAGVGSVTVPLPVDALALLLALEFEGGVLVPAALLLPPLLLHAAAVSATAADITPAKITRLIRPA